MTSSLSFGKLEVLVDAREDDSVSSWESAACYADVLDHARDLLDEGRHLLTLREYLALWSQTLRDQGSRACNKAEVWSRFMDDRDDENPISFVRHPFHSTVLVDTYLVDTRREDDGYSATVVDGGIEMGRVKLPPTGKIYEIDSFGLASRTGGAKCSDSDAFEHRWWAFSSDQLVTGSDFVVFANGGTIGCFCELVKIHYHLHDRGGFYRVLSLPDNGRMRRGLGAPEIASTPQLSERRIEKSKLV